MKTHCTMLLFMFMSSLSFAQGLSSFDALRSQLKQEKSQGLKYEPYLPETKQSIKLNWDERWPSPPQQNANTRDRNDTLKTTTILLDSMLVLHAQLLLKQASDLQLQTKNTLQKLKSTSHFNDSAFQAHIRTLYNSEALFISSFKYYATTDAILLNEYDTLVDSLMVVIQTIKSRINAHRTATPKSLKTATTFMNDINAYYHNVVVYSAILDSTQKKLYDNRSLLYEEEKKQLLHNNTFSELNTVPSIISSLSGLNIIPGINILGQRIYADENGGKIVGAYLFLAAEPEKKDSIKDPDYKKTLAYNILQPEASKFGFRFNYQKSFNISDIKRTFQQRAELQFQFNYLLKGIPKINNDSLRSLTGGVTTGFIQLKGGGELFFAQHFSVFAAMNYINAVQNNTYYLQYFSLKDYQNDLFFLNTGITASLSWGDKQQDVRISLDFIVNNDAIKRLYNSTDPLIPFLRFSFKPTSL